jgi:hypothetical protein
LGDWEIGRLGDWEIGRLGDWEIGRLGDENKYPISNKEYPMSKLIDEFRWKLEIECWILGVQK